jgi:AhpD family alkylhydroperoxidase
MPRIQPLSGAQAPLLLRVLNVVVRRVAGREAVPYNLMAHNPWLLVPYMMMGTFAGGPSRLDPRIRLLAMHRVSEINGCQWCLDYGASLAPRFGLAVEKLERLPSFRTDPAFEPRERAAISFAERVTQPGAHVPDDEFEQLRSHFTDREIVELLAGICAENFFNRFNAALEVEAQGFCALPQPRRSAA